MLTRFTIQSKYLSLRNFNTGTQALNKAEGEMEFKEPQQRLEDVKVTSNHFLCKEKSFREFICCP